MNSYQFIFVAVLVVLVQTTTAACVRTRLVSAPVCSAPIISAPLCPAPIISAPFCPSQIISAPVVPNILPSTTIVQTNSVTNSLVDVLAMLPVTSLLNDKLPFYSPLALPVAAPVYNSCGCGSIIF